MTVKEIEEKTAGIALGVIESLSSIDGLELIDTEYVKEGGTFYLRVFIDKPGGVTIDDCVAVTEPMNEILDAKPFIRDAYIFEVSSPGLDRPLKKDGDFKRNIGKLVEVKLFAPVDGVKEFEGELKEFTGEDFTILTEDGSLTFEKKKVALVRLAIKF